MPVKEFLASASWKACANEDTAGRADHGEDHWIVVGPDVLCSNLAVVGLCPGLERSWLCLTFTARSRDHHIKGDFSIVVLKHMEMVLGITTQNVAPCGMVLWTPRVLCLTT